MDAITQVPMPANEPVHDYAPQSPERARLRAALTALADHPIDLPHVIGGTHRMGKGERIDTGDEGAVFALGLATGGFGVGGRCLGHRLAALGFVDSFDQSPFGPLGLAQLILQALGGALEPLAPLLERLQARLHTRHLGVAQLDAGPQGAQLAPHFGRLPAGPGSAFGQAPLELLALGR